MSDLTLSIFCNAYVNRGGGGGGAFLLTDGLFFVVYTYNATPSGTMYMGGG